MGPATPQAVSVLQVGRWETVKFFAFESLTCLRDCQSFARGSSSALTCGGRMAQRKSLAAQLVQAYRDRQKAKAAAAKHEEQERARQSRAAERAAAERAKRDARREREQAQAWARKQKEKQTRQTSDSRRAEQIVRDLERREAARAREAEQKRRAEDREKAAAERRAKQDRAESMRQEAEARTAQIAAQVEELRSVLRVRPVDLHDHRLRVERALGEGDLEAFTVGVEGALAHIAYPAGLGGARRVGFAPESRELVLEIELPAQAVVPSVLGYRFKAAAPPAVVPQPRKESECRSLYRNAVACVALRAIDETFAVTPSELVDGVAFNGIVRAKDRATGKAIEPCLIGLRVSREAFGELVLDEPELDPVESLRYLGAVVSQHPYDLEPVPPVVTFDLSRYKLAPGRDVVAGLDSRPDLLAMDPTEFEHLIRRLFEKAGLKSWVTQASRDDGIDAVAVIEQPLLSTQCIIQAKRTKNVVPADTVRAVAGLVNDTGASKGIVVTTAWFGKSSTDFAPRNRLELIDGRNLKALLLEHLGIDALIGLPKMPPGWHPRDLS
ncbi:restriction endonuclease [Streptomyces sp. NPDC004647]|uniref:restriction endonuclease n=1 Tax=Streptomyces sp. NPDC004647 TaxID=3154671 RepID=UPI0033B354B1